MFEKIADDYLKTWAVGLFLLDRNKGLVGKNPLIDKVSKEFFSELTGHDVE